MKLKNVFFLFVLVLALLPVVSYSQVDAQAPVLTTTDINLNGVFDGGGGKYYIRQIDNEILWYGEENATSPSWSNVAHGIIEGDKINIKWADVPKGSIMQSGNLVVRIESNDVLVLESQKGEFFATDSWTRIP